MKQKRIVIGAIGILLVLAAGYALQFGLYPRYFDIEWDEEVRLHDGRVIVAHVKNTYERKRKSTRPYNEDKVVFRRKELTFEPNPGKRTTLITRMPVAYLGQFDAKWYVVISGQGPYGNYPEEMPNHWGNDFTTLEQRLAVFQDGGFRPIQWNAAPPELVETNLMESAFFLEFVGWNGKVLTLAQKEAFIKKHPTPSKQEITRPIVTRKIEGQKK